MRLAIDLAKATIGQTSPNPAVGAVIVNHGTIVGMGAHLKAGEAHAEVNALRMAGERAEGGTMYVTLEPCAHFGRTPPCADLIIEKGLKRVVIASSDPNPLVAGRGVDKLRRAGIAVETGVLREEADQLNRFFFHFIKEGTPFVTLKLACSMDGKIATAAGESRWITGEASRRDGHALRRVHDAILVGIGTVIADNPRLTVRSGEEGKNPVRVVLDTHLQIREEAHLVTDGAAPTWIFTGCTVDEDKARRLENGQVTIFRMPSERIEIKDVLKRLGDEKIISLLVEGGAAVHGSFLHEEAFQQVVVYTAPKLIGGKDAVSAIGGLGIRHLADVPALSIEKVERIEEDLKIILTKKGE
ncbi:bifunctional diaminohydroxyphosphoribosylaminopyrimidine deaminase/5-amino-6-(5-phosphoribosylamino)uracil reductase RibD [Sporolactobacillus sp. THM7-7]|nr:bifunctional diaminohydroxyphosphoribosylaminopyrimidine deaminase/5-amino-6-(5-phosphoribosylamino)uracil reductase RibD [Sporolactobacillus sp. THM7-7]